VWLLGVQRRFVGGQGTCVPAGRSHCSKEVANRMCGWEIKSNTHRSIIMAAVFVETSIAFAWAIYANGAIKPLLPTQEKYFCFMEMFGTELIVCVVLWDCLDPVNQIHKDAMPFHLLWFLYYVLHYPQQRHLSSFLKI
jgi:hypothetical protein